MINETITRKDNQPHEDEINLRKVLVIALKYWYLFLIFGFLGLAGGYFYSRSTPVSYEVSTTILVPPKSKNAGAGLEQLFSSQFISSKTEAFNQIEIMRSYTINNLVAQNLDWRVSWYSRNVLNAGNLLKGKNIFSSISLYGNRPFEVEELPGATNISGIQLNLRPVSATQFRISVKAKKMVKGIERDIDFKATGTYGQAFENEFFHFIITPAGKAIPSNGMVYIFQFNEPATIARSYMSRLSVALNDKESDIIRLKLTGTLPQMEIDYLNELVSVYMQNKMTYETETQKRSLKFIDTQLVGISDSLNQAGTNFSQFRSNNQAINLSEQGSQVMESLRDLESEYTKNKMQLDYFRNLLQYLEKSDDNKQLITPSVVGIQDELLNSMVLNLSTLYSKRQVLSFSATDDNPTLLMINKEIAQTNERLKENLRNLIRNAEVMNNSYENRRNVLSSQLKVLPEKEKNLINFQRRYDLTNEIYTFLLQKRAELDIALAGATPEVQLIDMARSETAKHVGMSRMTLLIIGLFIGLFLPSAYLIIRNFFTNTIESQEDIENHTKLPVLGNVIHYHEKSDTAVNDHPRSGIAESYRAIRTNLQFMLTGIGGKVIAIHSTNVSEGKSFTSVNLSTILAMNNKKVVIIGADMRKPRLHKIFGVPNEHGLSTCLSGQDQVEDVLLPSGIENLTFFPSGPIPPNPSELIDKPIFGELINKLREMFDYIIIDNAPVSLVTDGLLSGRHADLNVFILRHGVSPKSHVGFINQIAENGILTNIALVINDIHGTGFGYGQNYYYNYKYSYYNSYYGDSDKPTRKKSTVHRKRKTKAS